MRQTAFYLATAMTLCATWMCPASAVDVIASAILGPGNQPYGVATLEVPLAQPVIGQTLPPMTITTESGRLLYPVSDDVQVDIVRASERPVPEPGNGRLLGRLGKLIRELTDKDAPKTQIVARRISFLFTGQAPLQVRLNDGVSDLGVYPIDPINDPVQYPEHGNRHQTDVGGADQMPQVCHVEPKDRCGKHGGDRKTDHTIDDVDPKDHWHDMLPLALHKIVQHRAHSNFIDVRFPDIALCLSLCRILAPDRPAQRPHFGR